MGGARGAQARRRYHQTVRWARSLLVFCAALIALALLSELALRVAPALAPADERERYNARIVMSEDPALVWGLDTGDPQVNADGLRDRDFATAKPADTVRILALGDSVTYGFSLPAEETFAKRLEARLNEDGGSRRYEVLNLGVGGYNTLQELAQLERKGRKYDPDLVLVVYTLNDVLDSKDLLRSIGKLRDAGPAAPWWRRSRLASFVADRVAAPAPESPGQTPPRYFARLYDEPESWGIVEQGFAGFARVSDESGVPVVVVIFPYLDDLRQYQYADLHARVAREAASRGLRVLDLLDVFLGRDASQLRISRADTHPNERGHALAAERIRAYLRTQFPALAG